MAYREEEGMNMKMSKKTQALVSIVVLMVLLAYAASTAVPVHATAHDVTRIDDEVQGAPYSLFLPAEWNGDLILLVHGSIPGQFETLAQVFTTQGFGVAFMTLPPTVGEAAALKEVTLTIRIVQAQFTQHFGKPDRTYLFDFSRGAHTTEKLVETSPGRYAGVFSVCGGRSSQLAWDYFFTARILFDYYFPGVLPGDVFQMPPLTVNAYLAQVFPTVVQAVLNDLPAAEEMAGVDQYALRYNDPGELASGIALSLLVHSIGVNDLLQTAGNPFDNSQTVYTGTADDAALNEGVVRLTAEPQAVHYLRVWYEPDGTIGKTPVLVLHAERDPIVPERVNDKYEALITSTGNADFLVRRVIDRFGHCAFSNEELVSHFADLVSWVETGVRPTP
jgi:pimeloyl-ACP methyl ester carboxylesterase